MYKNSVSSSSQQNTRLDAGMLGSSSEASGSTSTDRIKRKQIFANSCGAVALLCSALELKVGGNLSNSMQSEKELYRNTSESKASHDLTRAGYSLPHSVAEEAVNLGLEVKIHFLPNKHSSELSHLYPQARQKCEDLGIAVSDTSHQELSNNQRALKVVKNDQGGLHWIEMRPDNSYMDPSSGRNAKSFERLNKILKKESFGMSNGYQDTGICLILTKRG